MCMGNNTSLKERIKISLCACSYFLPPNNIIYKGIIMLLNRNPLLSICRHNLTFTLSNFLFCHWYNGISQVCVSRFEPMPRNLYTGKTQNQSLYSLVIRFLYLLSVIKAIMPLHYKEILHLHSLCFPIPHPPHSPLQMYDALYTTA